MKPAILAIFGAAAVTMIAAGSAEAFTVYTNRSAWEAAVGSITTETFSTNIANASTITFANGIQSTGIGGFEENAVEAGTYSARVDTSGEFPEDFNQIQWLFPAPVVAFGADWFTTATGSGLTVSGNFDGTGTQTISFRSTLGSPGDGFLGIVGSTPFTQVLFAEETATSNNIVEEVFQVDNLSTATTAAAVPEPTTMAGLGLASLGLAAIRRKQKQQMK
jgi:hypothetical protein